MKELIIKDFKLLKFLNIFAVLVCLFIGFLGMSFENIFKSKLIYIFITVFISYIASMFLSSYDTKANSDVVINSLPINRYSVVKSKYMFMMIYMLISCTLVFISSNMSKVLFSSNLPGVPATMLDVLLTIGLTLLFYSVYLPIYYFNIGKSQALNQVLYMLFILAPVALSRLGEKFGSKILSSNLFKYFIHLNFNLIIVIVALIGLLFYLISLNISRKIYETKEF